MSNDLEVVLIDLSSISYPIYMTSTREADPDYVSTQIIARVRALASGHAHVAIACDSGKSFRHDIDEKYKGNRPPAEAALHYQIGIAKESLAGDGFPVWSVKGFEADDIMASATMQALATPDLTVRIITSDKDLLQLVGPRVVCQNAKTGAVMDEAGVLASEKIGVRPDQVRDFLTLCGDSSDNIKGAKGIAEKGAQALLGKFGTLDEVYRLLEEAPLSMAVTPGIVKSLLEFKARMPTVRQLITLRTDVEIPFVEIVNERVAPPVAVADLGNPEMDDLGESDAEEAGIPGPGPALPEVVPPPSTMQQGSPSTVHQGNFGPRAAVMTVHPVGGPGDPPQTVTALAITGPFEMELEPRSLPTAAKLAEHLFKGRLFAAYGNADAILTTLLAGRELGMQAMASLRAFHIIDNKPTLSADVLRAIVLRSGKAKYFRCTERTAERATFVTQRVGDPELSLSYTIEEGRAAFSKSPEAWDKSSWGKNPADMLVARASSKLARLVYSDVVHGIHASEEMGEETVGDR